MKNGLKTHFVAFTTSLDNTVYPNNFTDDQIQDIREKNGPANILFAQISDLSYEQVSSNSQIKSSNVEVYKTPSGQIYDSDIMQSIEGTYYGSSTVSNEDIINSFSDLVTATNDEQTQQKIDSLAYILAAHGNDIITTSTQEVPKLVRMRYLLEEKLVEKLSRLRMIPIY